MASQDLNPLFVKALRLMHSKSKEAGDQLKQMLDDLIAQRKAQMQSKVSDLSQLMRLWYLSHRRPAKAQASLRICIVSSEPSLFAHMKYGCRQRVRPKVRHLNPPDGCTCAFEESIYGGRKVP